MAAQQRFKELNVRNLITGLCVCAIALAAALVTPSSQAQTRSPSKTKQASPLALPALDEARLRNHINTLSSDFFEGRAPGSRGDDMATTYFAGALATLGLEPAGDNGTWFQDFTLNRFVTQPGATFAVEDEIWRLGDDVMMISRKADGSPTNLKDAPLVFAGYGVVAPERGWNDYAGIDWAGKIAVVLVNDPDFEATPNEPVAGRFGGKAMTWYGRWVYKFEAAAKAGAAGVLIVHEDTPAAYGWGVVRNSNGIRFDFVRADQGASHATVEGWMTLATATELLRKSGHDFATLKRAARTPGFKPIVLNQTATVTLTVVRDTIATRNVVGVLRGSAQADEAVVFGAHHDHLGRREPKDGDDIYNGAIDNASGMAAVLEVARTLSAGPRPARSIIFASWAAEEQGLLGSDYYVNNPAFPLAKTAAAFTVDGLWYGGPTRQMEVLGAGKTTLDANFRRALLPQGRAFIPDRAPQKGGFYRSDHFPFARMGVPAVFPGGGFVMGNGETETDRDWIDNHYHKPDDEYNPSWDFAGAVADIAVTRAVIHDIANSRSWPQWVAGDEFEAIRKASEVQRR
jgi:Zn-dependent M28 family amino/carboxypeptidase